MTVAKKTVLFAWLFILLTLIASFGCSTAAPSGSPTPSNTTPVVPPAPANPEVILATTTSTADSGLLDVLLPEFEKKTGYKAKPIAVGTGQAMTLGERGEADVLLVHAPDSEKAFMAAGHGTDRRLVMHNDFIIVAPASDPAGIKGMKSAAAAFKKIAAAGAIFVSRGDNSGTHQLELKVWKTAGLDPTGKPWYQSTGQGMGASLRIAFEKGAYIVTDRATYLANGKTLQLEVLVQEDPILLNIYHVIQVNPAKSARMNAAGAKAFADFMVAPETQRMIGGFGVDKFGQTLFFPDAGTADETLKNS